MATDTLNLFNDFKEQIGLGTWNLNTDTIRACLTNTLPVATNSFRSDITEIAYTNLSGWPADITNAFAENPAGTGDLTATDVTATASGGAVASFQYVVFYRDSGLASTDNLLGWVDYGATVSLADGESFTVDFGASLMTITG